MNYKLRLLNRGFLQHSLQLSEFPEKTGKETPLRLGYVGMLLRVWQRIPTLATEVKSCESKRAAGGSIHGKHPAREFWLKAEPMKVFLDLAGFSGKSRLSVDASRV